MASPAERVSLLLTVHGHSLRTAAGLCGLDHTTILKVRSGETENPYTLRQIAEAYGVPMEWLRGHPDLPTDFALAVLARPYQERVALLLHRERRLPFALAFLRTYAPDRFTVESLSGLLSLPGADVEAMLTRGRGTVADGILVHFCADVAAGRKIPHAGHMKIPPPYRMKDTESPARMRCPHRGRSEGNVSHPGPVRQRFQHPGHRPHDGPRPEDHS